jgi:alpha-mannosidase
MTVEAVRVENSESLSPRQRRQLFYTFGNHMHWVDMEWLWGYFVLPSSVRDMLAFCDQAGIKGNVNFDAVGYEKLAVEAPEALAELRAAIAAGIIEVAGGSYAQPYGQFHGGESNVRQRVFGARTVRRLLGVWPKTFWEEEFDFFPQLPQILAGAGFEYASLFYQWTWHTPAIPQESIPAIWWEGLDGTRLLTASRNPLNLHQWPEDFQLLLASNELQTIEIPGIIQWLELMPSPDWMCRSELMLKPLQQLLDDDRFEVIPVTLPEYLDRARDTAEVRRYHLDEFFHGLSLGKNGDLFRQLSAAAEHSVLAAETISVLAGFLGRPYPSWDVYPTWELEESWRELMIGQHHDNDECEGLNGHIGRFSYERSRSLSKHIIERTLTRMGSRTTGEYALVYNPLGWERDVPLGSGSVLRQIPGFSYRIAAPGKVDLVEPPAVHDSEERIILRRGRLSVEIDRRTGTLQQIRSADFPDGALPDALELGRLRCHVAGEPASFQLTAVDVVQDPAVSVVLWLRGPEDSSAKVEIRLANEIDAVDLRLDVSNLPWLDPGFAGAVTWRLGARLAGYRLIHDHPYGVGEIAAPGTFVRKYPTGDWMTSPQFFESVERPFSALQFIDFSQDDRGLLYVTGAHQSFRRTGETVEQVVTLRDPWDGDYFVDSVTLDMRILPHGRMTHADRWKRAQEFLRPACVSPTGEPAPGQRTTLDPIRCEGDGIVATALYRETGEAGAHVTNYAGTATDYPVIVRLVELNGEASTARIAVDGRVESAVRTNLLGAALHELPIRHGNWTSQIDLELRPFEIATVYLDPLLAAKQLRDLDAKREIWATIHRTDE